MNFHQFASVVNNQFNQMTKGYDLLYRVNISGDNLWDLYLNAFPEGTNEIYRERREYDCSTCRNFIKNIGNVVAIKDDQLVTVWDDLDEIQESAYKRVAAVLKDLVKNSPVVDVFATREASYGCEKNFEYDHVWHHFWAKIPQNHVRANVETFKGDARGQIQVFRRGLEELKEEATDTVLDLIADNNLYRGVEHKQVLLNFKALQADFKQSTNQNLFIWKYFRSLGSQIRNTAIGTLLIDLSKEVDLETAVKSFEGKVENELRLEILKDIIAVKLAERKAKQDEKTKAQEKQRLLEILAKKKDSALEEFLWKKFKSVSKPYDQTYRDFRSVFVQRLLF